MLTTDFTGTYDYEKQEALHEAGYLIECLQEGDFTTDELPAKAEHIRAHWRKAFSNSESFADFNAHFTSAINAYLTSRN